LKKPPGAQGGFYLSLAISNSFSILATEVFNMSVEKVVEKRQGVFVSDSHLRRFTTLH
jgi:diacylglycerol kinase